MKKKKILVIGGTGFLGYHLLLKCKRLNWEVVSLSKNKPHKTRKVLNVDYKTLDISKLKNLSKLKKNNFNYVVNFGGYIDHKNKTKTYNSHFLGVKNLFQFLKNNKELECFIQIGSSAEYGTVKSPQKEKSICKPKLIYGKSKLRATEFLLDKHKKFNFPVTILRLYQIYGPKQKIDRFIPLLINACIKNVDFIASHGKQKRDFLFVDDAINGIISSIKNKNCRGEIINIGSGKPITLLKIMKFVQKKIGGSKILLGKIKLRTDEQMIIYPNLKKAKKYLNWSNKMSFETGINRTIKEYKKEINSF